VGHVAHRVGGRLNLATVGTVGTARSFSRSGNRVGHTAFGPTTREARVWTSSDPHDAP
jgi:hypothetical protein